MIKALENITELAIKTVYYGHMLNYTPHNNTILIVVDYACKVQYIKLIKCDRICKKGSYTRICFRGIISSVSKILSFFQITRMLEKASYNFQSYRSNMR